jgi:hypothetical protein
VPRRDLLEGLPPMAKARDLAARAADGQAGRGGPERPLRRRDRRRGSSARLNRILIALAAVAIAVAIVALATAHAG